MSGLDYQTWMAEALLSVVPRAVGFVAEHGLPEGHALYISFDTRHRDLEIDESIRRDYPEVMTVVLESQFWDLEVSDEGFAVVLAFGGQRRPLYVPWDAVRAFADPPAEFAFDTSGSVAGEVRRLVGTATEESEPGADPAAAPRRFVAADRESRSPERGQSPAGRVVPFSRPGSVGNVSADHEEE